MQKVKNFNRNIRKGRSLVCLTKKQRSKKSKQIRKQGREG